MHNCSEVSAAIDLKKIRSFTPISQCHGTYLVLCCAHSFIIQNMSCRRQALKMLYPISLTLILMFWLVLSQDSPERGGFISIDCGANEDYTDDLGISYKTDAEFVDTGVNAKISPASGTNIPRRIQTLRFFPEGKRNCYTLLPHLGKNNKYLVRASFRYGNYDGQNIAPVFDIYLGVNQWNTVITRDSSLVYVYYETLHVPSTDYIKVCLVNTNSGVPFISALELRPINNSIYPVRDGAALGTYYRYNFAGSDIHRYKDDPYDRIWSQYVANTSVGWFPIVTNGTIDTQSSTDPYSPPQEVLMTAARSANSSRCLTFFWNSTSNATAYYSYFHFAEIEKLGDGQKRKLRLVLNGLSPPGSELITLEYGKSVTIAFPDQPLKGYPNILTICSLNGSTFPPILNALEIFELILLPDLPTTLNDVTAIEAIKKAHGVVSNWQGDPCVPSEFSWKGLSCSSDESPRIITLNLASSDLAGEIDSAISSLKSIEVMDLSNNNLNGSLPEFLGNLASLRVLNLSNNYLTGRIPESLAQLTSLRILNLTGNKLQVPQAILDRVNHGLSLRLEGNPDLCWPAPCKVKTNLVPVIASTIAAAILLIVSLNIWWKCKGRKRASSGGDSWESGNREFSYSRVINITNNFQTVIGEGGFGKVYSGTIEDGRRVAVKLLSPLSKQGPKEFQYEAKLLTRVHHGNLVTLVGYCKDGKNMVLVYEYMPNGNLRQHLSAKSVEPLDWRRRLQIAKDTAQGLDYLHNGCKPPIVHRDVKSSNILLDENWRAKIADFGLSRDSENDTTDVAGTFAYMDPEYFATRKLNMKSDVYSFGVVLLELITGQPPVVVLNGSEGIPISRWVSDLIERGDIEGIVDPRLQGDFNPNIAWKAVEIAMSCVAPAAIQRPEMSQVLVELKECLEIETAPATSRRRNSNEINLCSSIRMSALGTDTDIVPCAR